MAAAALRPLAHVGRRHQALAGAEVLRVHGRGAKPGSPSAERSGAGSPPPPLAARPAAARPAEPHAPPGCSGGPPLAEAGPVPGAAERCRAAPRRCGPPFPLLGSSEDRGGGRRLPGPRGANPEGGRLVGRGELAGVCFPQKFSGREQPRNAPFGCPSG